MTVLRRAWTRAPIRDRLAQELEQRLLLHREADAHDGDPFARLAQRLEGLAVHVLVEEARADVGRAADRGRVAELLGGRVDRFLHLPLPLGLARALADHGQRDGTEER